MPLFIVARWHRHRSIFEDSPVVFFEEIELEEMISARISMWRIYGLECECTEQASIEDLYAFVAEKFGLGSDSFKLERFPV